MQRIELSDLTNRLRRNLMLAASLIIGIAGFDIRVGKASASGMELENLTTEVILTILLVVLIYNFAAFAIRAFEEYGEWELTIGSRNAAFFSGSTNILDLASQLKGLGESLERIMGNTGVIAHKDQEIFTEADARNLRGASDAALKYAKRLKNFPTITRVRFWVWDIAVACAVTIIAALFAVAIVPAGIFRHFLLQGGLLA